MTEIYLPYLGQLTWIGAILQVWFTLTTFSSIFVITNSLRLQNFDLKG